MTLEIENIKADTRKRMAKFSLIALLSATAMMPLGCSNPVYPLPKLPLPNPEPIPRELTGDEYISEGYSDKY